MFLNKPKFIENLFQLFEDAEEELVLIVPYIKMSSEVYEALKACDKRKVQILMVCRKDCITSKELNKLRQLKHLTLLSHPNLHSKIYLNENDIIIGSMNLYEYSEKFNREAGLKIKNSGGFGSDEVEDCKQEIKEIISGSQEIIVSKKIEQAGVDYCSIELEEESLAKRARQLSQFLTTKSFMIRKTQEGLLPTCISFYDNIDVAISNRVAIMPNYKDDILNKVFDTIPVDIRNRLKPFRVYKNEYHNMFTLYAKEGEQINPKIYNDKIYAKKVESAVIELCREIDVVYRNIIN